MAKEPTTESLMGGEIVELLDSQLLEIHIRNKVISRRTHPTLPLAILNYTSKAQFEHIWDYVTMRCRGLIYNYETGDIVAVPFAKFFNYDTGDREETFPENLPTFEPEITEKLDGSLGILWRYKNEWGIATRGSFESEQAEWATEWAKNNLSQVHLMPKDVTLLFEIIYPNNQVVVKYNHEGLTLIGGINNKTGQELVHDLLVAPYGEVLKCPVVERIKVENLEDLLNMDKENEEGYVATWHHEEGPPLKVKIKFATYFRLHRLLTGTSPKRIWEFLKDGIPLTELVEDVPLHFQNWITEWVERLTKAFDDIEDESGKRFHAVGQFIQDRKTFALWANQPENKKYAPVLFKMRDYALYDDLIWKMVKPLTQGYEPFKTVDE